MRNALLKNNKKFLQRLNFCRLSLAFWKDKTVLKRKSSCNCKLSCYQPLTSKDGQGSVSLNHNGPWNDSFISAKAWERPLRAWPYSWRVHPENIPWRSSSWGPDHHGDPELINSWGPKFESNIYCVTPVPLCISFIDKIKSDPISFVCLFVAPQNDIKTLSDIDNSTQQKIRDSEPTGRSFEGVMKWYKHKQWYSLYHGRVSVINTLPVSYF